MGQRVKLSDLFQIGSSKRVLKAQWQKTGVPFYRGREITKLSQLGSVDNELFITEELYAEYADKYGVPTAGDIVITAIGTIGNSYIVSEGDRFYFKDASVLWLKKASEVDSKYINLWLKSPLMKNQLDEGNGATVDTLTIKKLQSLVVDLPSIPEQKRIVAILDQAFADIEQARTKTEQNLKNARELFESYLQQVFSQRGDEVSLSEITESISDGDHSAPPKSEEGIPFITISNINKLTNEIDFSNTFKVPESYYSSLKATRKPTVGDILYTVTGSYGIPVIVRDKKEFCFQRHIGLVRPNKNTNSNWLYYLLMSPQVFKQADEGATGTAQKTVSLKLLRSIKVPNIPLDKQISAVKDLDNIYQKSKKLEYIYTTKLVVIDELKKSILQKAFSGELTKTLEVDTNKGAVA
ncbi:restriction endonuclease subunit S [Pseudoalteromonas sp. MER144-MNA-CIBAN-0113]|uniref:restriction endonuclease subunit S n=1 Tax=Pseudoalteromonas sp. MER144-MNA-CIBAN-0113 TaxID=3140429 RepID=UPI0033325FBC